MYPDSLSFASMRFLAVLAFFLLLAAPAQAQIILVHGGGSFPIGTFSSGNNAFGEAAIGYTGGLDLHFSINEQYPLYVVGGVSFLVNDAEPPATPTARLDYGTWVNLPILVGLSTIRPVTPLIRMYAMGQVGLSIVRAPDIGVENVSGSFILKPDLSSAFAFTAGVGAWYANRVGLSLRYLGTTSASISYDTVGNLAGSASEGLPISTLLLTLSVVF